MARIAKSAAATAPTTAAKPAKVGKLDKAAPVAKPAKAAAEPKAPAAPRGEYASRPYRVTEAGKAAAPRGNRGVRWAIVAKGKNTADVLGAKFTRVDGAEGTITSAGLRNFVERGFVEFTD